MYAGKAIIPRAKRAILLEMCRGHSDMYIIRLFELTRPSQLPDRGAAKLNLLEFETGTLACGAWSG
jgi:hypothetical protein